MTSTEEQPRTFNTVLQFRAYTTREGYRRLDDVLAMHQTLYNAALQNRRDAWKMRRENITYYGQSRELTEVRRDDPEWAAQHRRLAGTGSRPPHRLPITPRFSSSLNNYAGPTLVRVSLVLQRRFIRRGDFREQFEPDNVLRGDTGAHRGTLGRAAVSALIGRLAHFPGRDAAKRPGPAAAGGEPSAGVAVQHGTAIGGTLHP